MLGQLRGLMYLVSSEHYTFSAVFLEQLHESLPIAGVVAASALPMLSPIAKAQPTELAAALTAHHVHAALVLLYRTLALGAGLCVGQDPVGVLTLCAVLAQPLVDCFAVHLHATARVLYICLQMHRHDCCSALEKMADAVKHQH